MEYELFSGITVMQLTVNHILKLLSVGQPPTLGRWLLPESQVQPRLIITHVDKGNYAGRVVAPGMVVAKVNGHEVYTLDDYRKFFEPAAGEPTWTLESDRGVLYATNFKESLFEQIEKAKQGMTFMFCESVVQAGKNMLQKLGLGPQMGTSTVTGAGTAGSLAETAASTGSPPTRVDTADHVSRLEKRHALMLSATLELEEATRRMRVAQSGFRVLAASEHDDDADAVDQKG